MVPPRFAPSEAAIRRVARGAIGLGAASTTSLAIAWLPLGMGHLAVAAVAGALACSLAGWVTSATSQLAGLGKTIVTGALVGALVALLSVVLLGAFGADASARDALLVAPLFAAFVGGMAAITFLPLTLGLRRVFARPSLASLDGALGVAGMWLVGAGTLFALAFGTPRPWPLLLPWAFAFAAGLAALLTTTLRRFAKSVFLRRVSHGRVRGWRIELQEGNDACGIDAAPLYEDVPRDRCTRVLVYESDEASEDAPTYRTAARPRAARTVALLP